jgi:sigma-B regulation protein RsbU (phosphoserine phosphatase)
MRVLVVDDTRANVDVLVGALRDDYKIAVAMNGAAALQSIAKSPPDLVLLDIMMPEMDGYEVCRRIRENPATRELPIVFLSALEKTEDKVKAFEAGGNDYVTKPFQMAEVRARVRAQLALRAYQQAIREAAAAELRIAGDIQRGILVEGAGKGVDGMPVDIQIHFQPARELGGDLFDVRRLDEHRVLVTVGDVSGKGVPAALFMAVTTTLVRSLAKTCDDPGEILARVNDELARHNPLSMFVTLFLGVLDTRDGLLRYALAGHPSPVSVRPGDGALLVRESVGTLAGAVEGLEFATFEKRLAPGEIVIVVTDGITEAFGPGAKLFEEERMLEALSHLPVGSGSAAAVAALNEAVKEFVAGEPASDDIAVVAFRVTPPAGHASAAWVVDSDSASVMAVVEDLEGFLFNSGVEREDVEAAKLALEETMSNVAAHAYGGKGGRIRVASALDPEAIVVEVRDDGPEFDPLRDAPKDLPSGGLEERAVGGLGLHLVRSMVQGLDWKREHGRTNRLRMTRRRTPAAS